MRIFRRVFDKFGRGSKTSKFLVISIATGLLLIYFQLRSTTGSPYMPPPVIRESEAKCQQRVERCKVSVNNEIEWQRLLLGSSSTSVSKSSEICKPKLIRIACQSSTVINSGSQIPCGRDIVIEEYDYHSQFACILKISNEIQSRGGTRIPRIGHSVFFYGDESEMKLHNTLSIISVLRHLKPLAYFFWNDGLPVGRWWIELLSRIYHPASLTLLGIANAPANYSLRFYSIRRRQPKTFYGRNLKFPAHTSDVARLDALLSFGGVYLDYDAFAVNDFTSLLNYPFVLGYERWGLLNNGIIFASRYPNFGILWHCQYEVDYDPKEWMTHSVYKPHILAEQCPYFIHIENSSLNQPHNYGDIHKLYGKNVYFNLSNNYVVHGWMWQFRQELDEKNILHMPTTMGRIWRALYYATPYDEEANEM